MGGVQVLSAGSRQAFHTSEMYTFPPSDPYTRIALSPDFCD